MNIASETEQSADATQLDDTPPSTWTRSLFGGLVAAVVAVVAGTQALAQITAAPLPVISAQWQRPAVAFFEVGQVDAAGLPVDPAQRERSAKIAVEASPMYPTGLAQIGIARQQARRRAETILPFMQLADRLSRRDPVSQGWLAEYYLRANKPDEAMYHVDMMLRSNPEIGQPVLNGMAQILVAVDARRAVARLINSRPRWTDSFLDVALSGDKPARPIGQLLLLVNRDIVSSRRDEFKARVIRRLVEDRDYDVLFALYPRMIFDRPGVNPWAFGHVKGVEPVAWSVAGDARFGGTIEPSQTVDAVHLEAWVMPGKRAVVMQKLFSLPATGEWQVVGRRLPSATDPDAYANWRVTCATAGSTQPMRESGNLFAGPAVTALPLNGMGCRNFLIQLVMSGGEAAQAVGLNLSDVRLVPTGSQSALPVPVNEVVPVP